MACVGAQIFAAMVVSSCVPSSSSRSRMELVAATRASFCGHHSLSHSHCLKVNKAEASAGGESCVADLNKETLADDEHYVKAGGSELAFVQMQ